MTPTHELDLAWAAGFLDGEGCFTLNKLSKATRPSQRGLHVGASQTRIEPLLKLRDLFGGKVRLASRTQKGSPIYEWRLPGNAPAIKDFIPQVLPYLVVKKREAEIVLAFAQTIRRRGRPKQGVIDFTSREEVATRQALIDELAGIREGESNVA